jgi:shikimate kinase
MGGKKGRREISAIFASAGEDYFRKQESEAIREALQGEGKVISTGGGALLRNKETLEKGGLLICLLASPGEIIQRLAGEGGRPLLAGDPQRKIDELYAARRPMYQEVSLKIDTEEKSPQEVALEILALLAAGCQNKEGKSRQNPQ